jgi:hypothetical protein
MTYISAYKQRRLGALRALGVLKPGTDFDRSFGEVVADRQAAIDLVGNFYDDALKTLGIAHPEGVSVRNAFSPLDDELEIHLRYTMHDVPAAISHPTVKLAEMADGQLREAERRLEDIQTDCYINDRSDSTTNKRVAPYRRQLQEATSRHKAISEVQQQIRQAVKQLDPHDRRRLEARRSAIFDVVVERVHQRIFDGYRKFLKTEGVDIETPLREQVAADELALGGFDAGISIELIQSLVPAPVPLFYGK